MPTGGVNEKNLLDYLSFNKIICLRRQLDGAGRRGGRPRIGIAFAPLTSFRGAADAGP